MNLSSLSEATLSIAAPAAVCSPLASRAFSSGRRGPMETRESNSWSVGSLLGAAVMVVAAAPSATSVWFRLFASVRDMAHLEGRILARASAVSPGRDAEPRSTTCSILSMRLSAKRPPRWSMSAMGSASARFWCVACPVRSAPARRCINAGTDAMDRRVGDLARVAQGFWRQHGQRCKDIGGGGDRSWVGRRSMAAAAEEVGGQSTAVAAASEQASTNVQTGRPPPSNSRHRSPKSRGKSADRRVARIGPSKRQIALMPRSGTSPSGPADRRCRQTHHRCRRADQPARTECHYRGGTRRRSRHGALRWWLRK